jgi:hypothetical protein
MMRIRPDGTVMLPILSLSADTLNNGSPPGQGRTLFGWNQKNGCVSPLPLGSHDLTRYLRGAGGLVGLVVLQSSDKFACRNNLGKKKFWSDSTGLRFRLISSENFPDFDRKAKASGAFLCCLHHVICISVPIVLGSLWAENFLDCLLWGRHYSNSKQCSTMRSVVSPCTLASTRSRHRMGSQHARWYANRQQMLAESRLCLINDVIFHTPYMGNAHHLKMQHAYMVPMRCRLSLSHREIIYQCAKPRPRRHSYHFTFSIAKKY